MILSHDFIAYGLQKVSIEGICMKYKKPRDEWIYFKTKDKVTKLTITLDPKKDGVIAHDADPGSMKLVRSYQRDSGKAKVLTSIPIGSIFSNFTTGASLKESFTYLMAIDTNSLEFKGKKLSICTCYVVPDRLGSYGSEIPFEHLVSYLIINPKIGINPETIGWHLVIENHVKPSLILKSNRLGIIVDSEKDALDSYNFKEEPYLGSFQKPVNISFCYASDKDKDSLPGKMIKMCHNVSNSISRKIKSCDFDIPITSNGGQFYEGYVWVKGRKA